MTTTAKTLAATYARQAIALSGRGDATGAAMAADAMSQTIGRYSRNGKWMLRMPAGRSVERSEKWVAVAAWAAE